MRMFGRLYIQYGPMAQIDTTRNIILGTCLVLGLVCIYWIISTIDQHFEEYLYGFWAGETVDGPCILYLDKDHIRLIESNEMMESASMKKGTYRLKSKSTIGMNLRSYSLTTSTLSSKSPIGRRLSQPNLSLDLYPIEGTCIIYDDSGDILTLIKDNKSNIELLI
jgi:hypothetical protein